MGPRKFRALFVASYKLFFSLSEAIRLDMALKVFIPDKTSRPSTLPMVVRTAQSLQVLTVLRLEPLPRSPRNHSRGPHGFYLANSLIAMWSWTTSLFRRSTKKNSGAPTPKR